LYLPVRQNGAVFIEGDVVALAATANDVDGTNLVVKFLAGTNLLRQFTNGPYTFSWTNAVIGAYALSAFVTDSDGATNGSAVVAVTVVSNQPPQIQITSPRIIRHSESGNDWDPGECE
jgi:hypothetical protein